MKQYITYNGYTAQPSDHECPDGDLAAATNLAPSNGALRPVQRPVPVLQLQGDKAGHKVIYIHQSPSFSGKHYIITDGTACHWITSENTPLTTANHLITSPDITVTAIGNTLIILTPDAINYYLWKGDDSNYKHLGDHLPEPQLSFGLKGRPRTYSVHSNEQSTNGELSGQFRVTFKEAATESNQQARSEFSDTNQQAITEQVMAKVNKFVADQSANTGRFVLPFLVRYALRLYDGSLICHSAPILMNPSTTPPVVCTSRIDSESMDCDIFLVSAQLDYQATADTINTLNNWKDIITSIDIFISKPIYTYSQSGKIKSLHDETQPKNFSSTFIGALDINDFSTLNDNIKTKSADQTLPTPFTLNITESGITQTYQVTAGQTSEGDKPKILDIINHHYTEYTYQQLYATFYSPNKHHNNTKRGIPQYTINLPEISTDTQQDRIESTSQFYLLKTITPSQLTTVRTTIQVPDDYLPSLTSREVMTDDYLSHDHITATYATVYNQRLNLAGISRRLFSGFTTDTMLARCQSRRPTFDLSQPNNYTIIQLNNEYDALHRTTVLIKENGRDYLVSADSHLRSTYIVPRDTTTSYGCYLFYPNANAYKMYITDTQTALATPTQTLEINLKPHPFLNGAYAFLHFNRSTQNATAPKTIDTSTHTVPMPDKIYTSDTANPFRFTASNINTIGTGSILGISTAAQALSQGQFGQFPLYAFCTDGVWALKVSAQGGFSAVQPITRDVCTNPKSITQIDSSVLFATSRGIMLLSGSKTTCISDSLINKQKNDEKLVSDINTQQKGLIFQPTDFLHYIKDCRMLYDYPSQRVILYNPSQPYSYIYSMTDKAWGMAQSDLTDTVSSDTQALATQRDTTDGTYSLVQFPTPDQTDTQPIEGLILTRPFKLNPPDALKTITAIIQRGTGAQQGIQSQILYGSRDLITWHTVWSSHDKYLRGFRGTPYIYFRLAVTTFMLPSESIHGFTAEYNERYGNKLR